MPVSSLGQEPERGWLGYVGLSGPRGSSLGLQRLEFLFSSCQDAEAEGTQVSGVFIYYLFIYLFIVIQGYLFLYAMRGMRYFLRKFTGKLQ